MIEDKSFQQKLEKLGDIESESKEEVMRIIEGLGEEKKDERNYNYANSFSQKHQKV